MTKALQRIGSDKLGPGDIPVEVWKCLGQMAVEFLMKHFSMTLDIDKIPQEGRKSILVPNFKNNGDVQHCSNYRGIKLMSHTMKIWKRVVEVKL